MTRHLTDTDIDALLHIPECPVIGPIDAGDWWIPVDEFVRFAQTHGPAAPSPTEVRDAVDAYAVARGGVRVPVRPAFQWALNALRRLTGRGPAATAEVWMFPMPAELPALRAGSRRLSPH